MALELNVDGFVTKLAGQLAAANGYSMELRRDGTILGAASRSSGEAINGQIEGGASTPWGQGVNMHIASCSKLITAMALTKILEETPGVTAADPIARYLPGYWKQGPNVGLITFADVMTQTSGLKPGTGAPDQTFVPCREAIAAGVADASKIGGAAQGNNWDYQNTNFVLCRVLMATVSGAMEVGAQPPDDAYWDRLTVDFYEEYLQLNVFAPARAPATLTRPAGCALAYAYPADGDKGWSSGDLTDWAGPAGYHMSVSGLLDVMSTFRRGGTILSPAAAQAMLDARYGIDWGDNGVPGVAQPTPAGPLYCKNGGQASTDAARHAQQEQSGAVFFPLGMECVVFVNSVLGNDAFLLSLITGAFIDNLVEAPAAPGPPIRRLAG